MHFKTITTNLLKIVQLLVDPITSLAIPMASLEAYISIWQPHWIVISSKPVVYPYLFSFFFGNMLRSNRYWWGTVESHVKKSADRCGGRNTTGKMNCAASRNCIFIIDLIKGRYLFSRVSLSGKKGLLKQFWASRSDNSLILINLS